jgi:hypothetical protein
MSMKDFSKRQWLTLVVFSIADFCNAICVSLQAPFYPKEVSLAVAPARISRRHSTLLVRLPPHPISLQLSTLKGVGA